MAIESPWSVCLVAILLGAALASQPAQGMAQPLPALEPHPSDGSALALSVDLCLDLPTWQRPSRQLQDKQLQALPDYGLGIEDGSLSATLKTWWTHQIFAFTTYGLSARTDPLYLSGLWTAMEATWSCYAGDQPDRFNQGQLAELWLIQHRLLGIEWRDHQYIVTVEPSQSGLQLVQFPRQETAATLPLSLISSTGERLPVLSGDW
ncbi:MAG: hypothetical protein VKL98_05595 [Cyanobacteriota bacterium]|nr:hypothetical protein [Cyanobacteriota bacterium]